MNSAQYLVTIIYDGIENSVFDSQVLQPLIKKKEQYQSAILISFEKNSSISIPSSIPQDISVLILKKYPYIGIISLLPAIFKVTLILRRLKNYTVIARGPIAGYISCKAANPQCQGICIQARGLLTKEYDYATQSSQGFMKIIHRIRRRLYARLEYKAYAKLHQKIPVTIEAVSSALKNYLMRTYNIKDESISIATQDLPPSFDANQILAWRQEIRNLLQIDEQTTVLCYNGSAKTWQCPEMVIDYFRDYQQKNPNSFLLILTQDTQIFIDLLQKTSINNNQYHIKTVGHSQIYRYLAACDYGMIFRKPHIINWTSRPTKVLEYQTAGLPIIHNDTIEMVSEGKAIF